MIYKPQFCINNILINSYREFVTVKETKVFKTDFILMVIICEVNLENFYLGKEGQKRHPTQSLIEITKN